MRFRQTYYFIFFQSAIFLIGRAPQIRTEIERILSALPMPLRIVRDGAGEWIRTTTEQILMVGDTSAALA